MAVKPWQTKNIKGSSGVPLPTVFDSLRQLEVNFYRGDLVMIAAASNVGKSIVSLWVATKSGVPTLYFSADSGPVTQVGRLVSMETDLTAGQAKALVKNGGHHEILNSSKIEFSFQGSPDLEFDIGPEIQAYYQQYGEDPALIVFDNLTDIVTGQNADDPFAGLETLLSQLHKLARDTGACVIVTHHVKGEFGNGDVPVPQNGIKGQVSRVPNVILTLYKVPGVLEGQSDTLMICPVKNRDGAVDQSGNRAAAVEFDAANMRLIET